MAEAISILDSRHYACSEILAGMIHVARVSSDRTVCVHQQGCGTTAISGGFGSLLVSFGWVFLFFGMFSVVFGDYWRCHNLGVIISVNWCVLSVFSVFLGWFLVCSRMVFRFGFLGIPVVV